MIELEDVYLQNGDIKDGTADFLLRVLSERDDITNISHVEMPNYEDHCWFILTRPYLEWWLIAANGEHVGSVYISRDYEIGLFILRGHARKGYGQAVIRELKRRHAGTKLKLYANINPRNAPSIALFEGEDFKHIQNTYRFDG